MTEGVGVGVPLGARIFTSLWRPDRPPIQWVSGGECLFLGLKRPGREADHSPPTSAEVKKTWVYTFTPQYVFVA
jgi:hypothetical protein